MDELRSLNGRLEPKDWKWARANEHRVMARIAALGLFVGLVAVELASLVPELSPNNVEMWRVALGVPILLMVGVSLRYCGGRSVPTWQVVAGLIVMIAIATVLIHISPPTWAMMLIPVVIVLYASYFMSGRVAFLVTAALSVSALSLLVFEPSGLGREYDTSRMVVYIPTLWALAISMHLQVRDLRNATAAAVRASTTDIDTGAHSARFARETVEAQLETLRQNPDSTLGLVLVEVDDLRDANAGAKGTAIMAEVAGQIERIAQSDWAVGRVGTEEFLVVVPDVQPQRLQEISMLIRGAARSASLQLDVAVDASVGTAQAPLAGDSYDELLEVAQANLFVDRESSSELRTPNAPRLVTSMAPAPIEAEEPVWRRAFRSPLNVMFDGLDLLVHKVRGHAAGLGLIGVALVTLAALSVPGADRANSTVAIAISAVVALAGFAALFAGERDLGKGVKTVFDVSLFCLLAALIAASGGTLSPAMILVFVYIAAQAWIWQGDRAVWRVIAPVSLLASPLIYESVLTRANAEAQASFQFHSMLIAMIVATASVVAFRGRVSAHEIALAAAAHDPETGLLNETTFEERLVARLDGFAAEQSRVLAVDLRGVEQYTRHRGRDARSQLLVMVGQAVQNVLEKREFAGRTGTSRFAIYVEGDARHIEDREATIRFQLGRAIAALDAGAANDVTVDAKSVDAERYAGVLTSGDLQSWPDPRSLGPARRPVVSAAI